ncbi:MAG TPA: hypothetical protein VFM51_11420 [Solirubrobacterales bacterium]|nr:hypothetical protein [Solirubrobacterales bacterium]
MSVVQDLLKSPPKDLLNELKQIRERERLLAQERELIERVFEILLENDDSAADLLNDPDFALVPIGPLRSQILRVMKANPERKTWVAKRMHDELSGIGSRATVDNVRTTMRRMAANKELIQPDPTMKLRFALPPKQRAKQGR